MELICIYMFFTNIIGSYCIRTYLWLVTLLNRTIIWLTSNESLFGETWFRTCLNAPASSWRKCWSIYIIMNSCQWLWRLRRKDIRYNVDSSYLSVLLKKTSTRFRIDSTMANSFRASSSLSTVVELGLQRARLASGCIDINGDRCCFRLRQAAPLGWFRTRPFPRAPLAIIQQPCYAITRDFRIWYLLKFDIQFEILPELCKFLRFVSLSTITLVVKKKKPNLGPVMCRGLQHQSLTLAWAWGA